MKRQYHKWFSDNLGREMELLVFGHAGAKVLVFPTREGRFFDYENWGMVDALRPAIDGGKIRLFCVGGVDSESFYCRTATPRARVERHREYERYLLQEVIPFLLSENGVPSLVVHGCSIGAYHAVNLALKHPSLFCKVVALSGRYDLTRNFGVFQDLFSGHYDQDIYFLFAGSDAGPFDASLFDFSARVIRCRAGRRPLRGGAGWTPGSLFCFFYLRSFSGRGG